MDIIELLIILIVCFSSPIAFLIIMFVEKRLDENSKFGKWWRRHIVDLEPKDDNTK
jgi:hypothetical protein